MTRAIVPASVLLPTPADDYDRQNEAETRRSIERAFAQTMARQPKQTVTGAKGGNAALASLLTALANLGLIVDSTT